MAHHIKRAVSKGSLPSIQVENIPEMMCNEMYKIDVPPDTPIRAKHLNLHGFRKRTIYRVASPVVVDNTAFTCHIHRFYSPSYSCNIFALSHTSDVEMLLILKAERVQRENAKIHENTEPVVGDPNLTEPVVGEETKEEEKEKKKDAILLTQSRPVQPTFSLGPETIKELDLISSTKCISCDKNEADEKSVSCKDCSSKRETLPSLKFVKFDFLPLCLPMSLRLTQDCNSRVGAIFRELYDNSQHQVQSVAPHLLPPAIASDIYQNKTITEPLLVWLAGYTGNPCKFSVPDDCLVICTHHVWTRSMDSGERWQIHTDRATTEVDSPRSPPKTILIDLNDTTIKAKLESVFSTPTSFPTGEITPFSPRPTSGKWPKHKFGTGFRTALKKSPRYLGACTSFSMVDYNKDSTRAEERQSSNAHGGYCTLNSELYGISNCHCVYPGGDKVIFPPEQLAASFPHKYSPEIVGTLKLRENKEPILGTIRNHTMCTVNSSTGETTSTSYGIDIGAYLISPSNYVPTKEEQLFEFAQPPSKIVDILKYEWDTIKKSIETHVRENQGKCHITVPPSPPESFRRELANPAEASELVIMTGPNYGISVGYTIGTTCGKVWRTAGHPSCECTIDSEKGVYPSDTTVTMDHQVHIYPVWNAQNPTTFFPQHSQFAEKGDSGSFIYNMSGQIIAIEHALDRDFVVASPIIPCIDWLFTEISNRAQGNEDTLKP